MNAETCSVRLCRKPAVSNSPITSLALCSGHLQSDLSKVKKLETSVAERIAHLRKYRTPLRLMQQRLTSDLQCLDDNFNALRETLNNCQKELVDIITQHHDQLLDSLRTLSDLDDFEKDLKAAKEQNDVRQAFLLNESVEKSLETLQLDSNLVCMDEETQEVKMVAYPDVNLNVRDMQACAEFEFYYLQAKLGLLDVKKTENDMKVSMIEINSNGEAMCAAMCNNTRGFVIDKSGCIIRAQTGQDDTNQQNVPQPSVFVAVKSTCSPDSESSSSEKQDAYGIMLVCADPQVSATLTPSWDESLPIVDLHCDDTRQKLFVAQSNAITVTDLSGISESKIFPSHLHEEAEELYCISGDGDKLYVLSNLTDGKQIIFSLAIGTVEVQMQIQVPSTCNLSLGLETKMAVRDGMMMVSDSHHRFTICLVTSLHVNSEKIAEPTCLFMNYINDLESCDADDTQSVAKMLPFVSNRRISSYFTYNVQIESFQVL